MNAPYLYHGQDSGWVSHHENSLILTVASKRHATLSALFVRCDPDNEERLVEMQASTQSEHLQFWQATIPCNRDRAITSYCFKALAGAKQWWLDSCGIRGRSPGVERHFRFNPNHQPPTWFKEQVFYQIFPDRFANGDPSISVADNEYCLRGDQMPTIAKPWGSDVSQQGYAVAGEFFGGDLAGIQSRLDHLQQLGITALYLNPIFTAPTNHKYDTSDYLNVDPHLGTNQQLADMVTDLHQRDMRIILDAVFNHTSVDHSWFDKHGRQTTHQGAFTSPQSPYRDYYQFDGDSDNYIGWNGHPSLPKLNFSNPKVQEYIYAGDDAVIKHWLKPPYNIDGWRFDVIHMLGEGEGAKNNAHFVKAFRAAAKSINPESFILGEHFFEATKWLQGEQEDGAMNYYGFAHPLRVFFAQKDIAYHDGQIDAETLIDWLDEARAKIPWLNQLSQLNQLDSHDTMRFITTLDGDIASLHLAYLMLFSYIGTPCLYYGSEVALEGGQDPDNRRTFPWERMAQHEPHPSFEYLQKLIAYRKQRPSLQKGSLQWLYGQDQMLGFARTLGDEVTVCVINNSTQPQTITLPVWQLNCADAHWTSLLSSDRWQDHDGQITLTLDAKQGMLIARD